MAVNKNKGTGAEGKTLTPVEAITFVQIMTHLFTVEERDFFSHWFRILCD